jgi:2-haloacid dehalogenase
LKAVEKEFGIKKEQVLHTFQSLFHDAVPACKIGMATSHIDRRFGKAGSGATPIPSEPFTLNFYYKTLGDMADAREKEQ